MRSERNPSKANGMCLRLSLMALLVACVMPVRPAHAGWMDDWMANSSSVMSSAGSFHSQTRDFATAGSFSQRWPIAPTTPLVNFQAPRIKSGCGGVDIFWGGVSFLNIDYLVKKFQNIVVNAAAVSFHLGLNLLCTPCSVISNTLESIESFLNSMQQDSCSIATNLAQAGNDKLEAMLGPSLEKYQVDSNSKWPYEHVEDLWANDNKADTTGTEDIHAGCPTEWMQAIFGQATFPSAGKTVSLLDNIGSNFSFPGSTTDAIPAIRGLVGDIQIIVDANEGMKVYPQRPCEQNESLDAAGFVAGNLVTMGSDMQCSNATAFAVTSLEDWTQSMLDNIADKMMNKTALTAPEIAFLDTAPLTVMSLLKQALLSDSREVSINAMVPVIAYQYAANMLEDINGRLRVLLYKIDNIKERRSHPKSGNLDYECEPYYKPKLEEGMKDMKAVMDSIARKISKEALESEKRFKSQLEYQESLTARIKAIKTLLGETFGEGVLNRVRGSL